MLSNLRQILYATVTASALVTANEPDTLRVMPQPEIAPTLEDVQLPLELGGYFTFDASAPLSHWARFDIPYQLSWMELTAQAPISENVTGAITLLSTGDLEKLRVWQCMASWESDSWLVSGGQQNYHFGLFTTRTVTGPLIWDSAWRNAPGAEIGRKLGETSVLGIGFASVQIGADSATGREETNAPTLTGYLDWTPSEGNDFRLSGIAGEHFQDADLAGTLTWKRLLVDAEIWGRFNTASQPDYMGWYTGAGLQLTDDLVGGIRYDRLSLDGGESWSDKICAGGVFKFFRDLFVGGEIGHDQRTGYYLDLQFGLSTHLGVMGVTPRQPGR